jgi:DNA polymerase epsilon subunit 1
VSQSVDANGSSGSERAGLDLYFWTPAGNKFKTTVLYRPYFFLMPNLSEQELSDPTFSLDTALELVATSLLRKFDGHLYNAQVVYKIDLDQPNHLSPTKRHGRPMLKLLFDNVSQLMEVRGQLRSIVEKNQARDKTVTFQDPALGITANTNSSIASNTNTALDNLHKDPFSCLVDIREYDVPYVVRVCTDLNIRVGTWYTVTVALDETGHDENTTGTTHNNIVHAKDIKPNTGGVTLSQPDCETKADPTFLAFDIECTKAPLKFPSASVDEIFMISYMVSGPPGQPPSGYLIVSRSVVSQDVKDFEYTPLPKYPGPFHIFNEPDEAALLKRFFEEYQRHQPQIVVTYNGDFFDWPFVEARAAVHGIDLFEEVGVEKKGEEYSGRCSVHLDAFHWVQRDSYLPQGAQGLKAVTKYKLGYDPVEVDPEDMVRFAQERPVHMASYSVSDAVATYYLHEKYVHLFIFSLCTIIPMGPEDVLRKGSGTLCETLLMVQACEKDIICPNKQIDPLTKFHNGHLLESETYIGGKVECLETGVYRSDIEYDFDLKPTAFQQLIDNIDRDLNFAIEVEGGMEQKDVVNYDEVRMSIVPAKHISDLSIHGILLPLCSWLASSDPK